MNAPDLPSPEVREALDKLLASIDPSGVMGSADALLAVKELAEKELHRTVSVLYPVGCRVNIRSDRMNITARVAMHGYWWSRPSDIKATNEKSGKSRWFDVCRSDVRVTKAPEASP